MNADFYKIQKFEPLSYHVWSHFHECHNHTSEMSKYADRFSAPSIFYLFFKKKCAIFNILVQVF